MKDMEREKFEQSWKDALDDAAVSPSESVWTNIELELEKASGGELKKRVLFYKMLAAASVIFAMAIGGAGYYVINSTTSPANLAVENTSSDKTSANQTLSNGTSATNMDDRGSAPINDEGLVADAQPTQEVNENATADLPAVVSGDARTEPVDRLQSGRNADQPDPSINALLAASDDEDTKRHSFASEQMEERPALPDDLPGQIKERDLPQLYTPREIALVLPPAEEEKEAVDPVVAMLARLERREREIRGEEAMDEKERGTDENLWTSIGFAAGSFNSIASAAPGGGAAGSRAAMTLAAPIVDQETKASGYSYSMGINVGTRISERWVLQGGVNYLTQATEYTADNVVMSASAYQQRFHPATTNELIKSNALDFSNKLVYTAPYNVSNSMRYISIPMQAGYMLIQKTVGLQLNAGVSTDLFLQNTIEANSDQIDKTTQGSGADSPYRTVNLSGLFGTEVSYRFNDNYRISLNPGIRYPFNTIYKSELGVESTPLTFDIGLRFRYIFH